MSLGRKLKVQTSAGFAVMDPSTMSGDDRRVSIRTTLATSLTRALDTAGSLACRDGISETSATKDRRTLMNVLVRMAEKLAPTLP